MQREVCFITGATSGIGAAFAKAFAKKGYDLIISGRREDKIKKFAGELQEKHGVNVEVVIAELANDNDFEQLIQKIKIQNKLLFLVNNAGFGYKSNFHDGDIAVWEAMYKVHTKAIMRLTYEALPKMLENKRGNIINVSSILAFFPYRKHAIYNASKAFLNLFTKTVAKELKNTGVRLQVLCPGLTVTDFHAKMGVEEKKAYKSRWFIKPMQPEDVVERSLKALGKNKVVCVPGFSNKLITSFAVLIT